MLSIIIPANNEADYIGKCLESLLAQEIPSDSPNQFEVLVAANGCSDDTADIARRFHERFAARDWALIVLDIEQGGKANALNEADAAVSGDMRMYLDADVVCDPDLLNELRSTLDRPEAVYASGRLVVAPARSWITRKYGTLWSRLPFMRESVPGAGLFAVNAAGRARWNEFPSIIADDGYVRLLFSPEERVQVSAAYYWPMIEGFSNLVKVRRRQDAGGREIAEKYPDIVVNETKSAVSALDHLKLFLGTPISYAVYVTVAIAVRLGGVDYRTGWTRGR